MRKHLGEDEVKNYLDSGSLWFLGYPYAISNLDILLSQAPS